MTTHTDLRPRSNAMDGRPTGDEAIRALVDYVAALGEVDLPAVQQTRTGSAEAPWDLRFHRTEVRPVGDYIHGISCHRSDPSPCGAIRPRDEALRVRVAVSQYLVNSPVDGYGATAAEALADLKQSWSSLETARATLAAKGWGPSHPGTYAHAAYDL